MKATTPSPSGPSSQEAAYVILRSHLRTQDYRPGERIGAESEIFDRLGLGRAHGRTALTRLEKEGLVRRVLGRTGGVFAHDGRIQRHLNTIRGVPEMTRMQGMTTKTRVLRVAIATPAPDESRALSLTSDESVAHIDRLRIVDDLPWSLDRSVVPLKIFPGITAMPMDGSLYALFLDPFGIVLDRAEETIEVASASGEEGELLTVDPGSPLLLVRRVTWDNDGRPVEYATDRFRSDRTRIHMQKIGTNWKNATR